MAVVVVAVVVVVAAGAAAAVVAVEEVDPVALGVLHVTMTVGMIVDTTEVAMIAMKRGTTTNPTKDDLHHHITEVLTGLGPDHGLTLPVVIERCC